MQTIKKFKTPEKNYLKYKINGELYRAYTISNLPAKFGTDKLTSWYTVNELGSGHAGLVLISESNFESWN
tara:strand:- start:516 stop:725 length:210 start_codon:yes stop_codon:yes gene_type:complete